MSTIYPRTTDTSTDKRTFDNTSKQDFYKMYDDYFDGDKSRLNRLFNECDLETIYEYFHDMFKNHPVNIQYIVNELSIAINKSEVSDFTDTPIDSPNFRTLVESHPAFFEWVNGHECRLIFWQNA